MLRVAEQTRIVVARHVRKEACSTLLSLVVVRAKGEGWIGGAVIVVVVVEQATSVTSWIAE